jgi:hypothetical protein
MFRPGCAAILTPAAPGIGRRSASRDLAPLFFHVQGTGYVSDSGHFAARFEGSYDLLLTNTLILQPEFEINLYSKSDPSRLIGTGISEIDTGLRLRYEFDRKFAPYIGPIDPDPTICPLYGRCPCATDLCKTAMPTLREVAPGRLAACHYPIPDDAAQAIAQARRRAPLPVAGR